MVVLKSSRVRDGLAVRDRPSYLHTILCMGEKGHTPVGQGYMLGQAFARANRHPSKSYHYGCKRDSRVLAEPAKRSSCFIQNGTERAETQKDSSRARNDGRKSGSWFFGKEIKSLIYSQMQSIYLMVLFGSFYRQ
jgi:hypothetical protein